MTIKPDAVYFAAHDYAHLRRRAGAVVVDLIVLYTLVWLIASSVGFYLGVPQTIQNMPDSPERRALTRKHLAVPLAVGLLGGCTVYPIAMRRLRGGTLGYRLMRIRLVDKTGEPPSFRVLIKRFFLALLFLMPLGASYFRCRHDPKRQALHDQFSGTWVVRKRAEPAGPALITHQHKLFGTFLLRYIDVEPPDPAQHATAAAEPTEDRAEVTSQTA